jgi:hypothetical protein
MSYRHIWELILLSLYVCASQGAAGCCRMLQRRADVISGPCSATPAGSPHAYPHSPVPHLIATRVIQSDSPWAAKVTMPGDGTRASRQYAVPPLAPTYIGDSPCASTRGTRRHGADGVAGAKLHDANPAAQERVHFRESNVDIVIEQQPVNKTHAYHKRVSESNGPIPIISMNSLRAFQNTCDTPGRL